MSKSSKSLHCLVTLLSAENSIDNSITIRTLYIKNISATATTSKVSPWSRVQTPPRALELRFYARVTQWSEWGSYEGSMLFANFPLRGVRLGSWQGCSFWFFPHARSVCACIMNQDSLLQFPTVFSFLIVHPSIRARVVTVLEFALYVSR